MYIVILVINGMDCMLVLCCVCDNDRDGKEYPIGDVLAYGPEYLIAYGLGDIIA